MPIIYHNIPTDMDNYAVSIAYNIFKADIPKERTEKSKEHFEHFRKTHEEAIGTCKGVLEAFFKKLKQFQEDGQSGAMSKSDCSMKANSACTILTHGLQGVAIEMGKNIGQINFCQVNLTFGGCQVTPIILKGNAKVYLDIVYKTTGCAATTTPFSLMLKSVLALVNRVDTMTAYPTAIAKENATEGYQTGVETGVETNVETDVESDDDSDDETSKTKPERLISVETMSVA